MQVALFYLMNFAKRGFHPDSYLIDVWLDLEVDKVGLYALAHQGPLLALAAPALKASVNKIDYD